MVLFGVAHIDFGSEQPSDIFDVGAGLVKIGLAIVAAAMTGWDFRRQLWTTIGVHQAQQKLQNAQNRVIKRFRGSFACPPAGRT